VSDTKLLKRVIDEDALVDSKGGFRRRRWSRRLHAPAIAAAAPVESENAPPEKQRSRRKSMKLVHPESRVQSRGLDRLIAPQAWSRWRVKSTSVTVVFHRRRLRTGSTGMASDDPPKRKNCLPGYIIGVHVDQRRHLFPRPREPAGSAIHRCRRANR